MNQFIFLGYLKRQHEKELGGKKYFRLIVRDSSNKEHIVQLSSSDLVKWVHDTYIGYLCLWFVLFLTKKNSKLTVNIIDDEFQSAEIPEITLELGELKTCIEYWAQLTVCGTLIGILWYVLSLLHSFTEHNISLKIAFGLSLITILVKILFWLPRNQSETKMIFQEAVRSVSNQVDSFFRMKQGNQIDPEWTKRMLVLMAAILTLVYAAK